MTTMATIDVLLDGLGARTEQGLLGFCSLLLVEGEQRTLVDVGHVGRRTLLLDALAARGLTPADIDNVLLSHSHWDHAQNLDAFASSRILMHPLERRYSAKPHRNDWATPGWTGAMLEHEAERIVEVDEGFEIEPGVRVLHTPGHSVGSISLAVDTDDGTAAVTGDVLHYASAALTRKNPIVFWSEEEATTSINRLVDLADVIYPGHDRPFRLPAGDIEYLRPYEFTVVNAKPDDPGFSVTSAPPAAFVMEGIEEQTLPLG
jgi:glyoxylase-like metal-dependent hydrolase (beta-lactamase superfamily II)